MGQDEGGNVMVRLKSQPLSIKYYGNESLLFLVAGWIKPKLSVKRRRSDH